MSGIELIAAERQRQIEQEGWTPEHDDGHHDAGELARAAACYAVEAACKLHPYHMLGTEGEISPWWPWAREWWKPKDPLRDLVRAGALIVAEIDKLQRAAMQQDRTGAVLTVRRVNKIIKAIKAKRKKK